ncbi:LysM peptidoglycan-binding domain-containing protein, partial [Paenibacillus algorifonticola]|uniref:LysM peptidoglycan-binding domain-containing protein n=1 Tax=Paenibacillus algorifonticola TaxID=684063 RepID=UPI003D274AEA
MKIYVVKKGDSLYLIGQKHHVTVEEILKLNPSITNPDVIEVGMKIKIPSSSHETGGMDIMHQYVVKQGDTLWKLSKAWGVPLADMIKANPQLKNPNVLMTGEIVNVPKAGHMTTTPATETGTAAGMGTTAAGTGTGGHTGHHALHPLSVMQGVQQWVGGKKPTGQIPGKTPTAPITKTPTAPIAKTPTAPITKVPTAPIVTPTLPEAEAEAEAVPAPLPKPLPIEKPVEKKMYPVYSHHQQSVDLFMQYGTPAVEASSTYPTTVVSPAATAPSLPQYGGYSMPTTVSPTQTGGYGHWQQPTMVSPVSQGGGGYNPCPPGMYPIGGMSSGYGYGGMVSPAETQGYGYGGMVSPAETQGYGYGGMVS